MNHRLTTELAYFRTRASELRDWLGAIPAGTDEANDVATALASLETTISTLTNPNGND